MKIRRRELCVEIRFAQEDDFSFTTLKRDIKASDMVLKYIYHPELHKDYRFSAYVTGFYDVNGYWQTGKRTFTSGSKNMPSWILQIALSEAPEWFKNA